MPKTKRHTVNFTLRIDPELRDWIAHRAVDHHRSINNEIVTRLEESKRNEETNKEKTHG